jgi:hypothetical protein
MQGATAGACKCRRLLPLCMLFPVIPCSWDLGSRKIKTLVLITFCLGCVCARLVNLCRADGIAHGRRVRISA